jgi:hypothetical protein
MKQQLLLTLLLFLSGSILAQRANPDALANRNAKLEILLLEYKEQLQKNDTRIKELYTKNRTLKKGINTLMGKKDKTGVDINQLMKERNQLLSNKLQIEKTLKQRDITIKLLEDTNRKLQKDNAVLQTNNAILEEAASVADTIQRYQDIRIKKQAKSIQTLIDNYSQKCSEITGQYKSPLSRDILNVVLDGSEKGPNNKNIESLTVSACFQLPTETAKEKVIVYFTLFDKKNEKAIRRIRFAVPKTENLDNISYYEGRHRIDTKGQLQLSDGVKYYYEITYLENIIAKGAINPS